METARPKAARHDLWRSWPSFLERLEGTNLFILAITSTQPGRDRVAVGVPEIERRRAGLDPIPLWFIVDKYNHDILESSAYFEPGARIGAFSPSFHKKVMSAFIAAVRAGQSKVIPRAD